MCHYIRTLIGFLLFTFSTTPLLSTPVWTEYTGDLAGWKESPWFGWFSSHSLEAGWAYHYEHGDIWIQGPSEEDLWFWDFDMGWLWTSQTYYPYVYGFAEKSWLLYVRQTLAPRWYYHYGYNLWIQAGSGYPASTTTTAETQTGSSAVSMPSMISLSDGSAVEMPPLGAQMTVTLGRENTDYAFSSPGLQVSGATRALTVEPVAGMDPDSVEPRIIFPGDQTGTLVQETINVLRVETIPDGLGGTIERKAFLPVTFHDDGTYSARDFMMPETVHDAQAAATSVKVRSGPGAWENGQTYAPSSRKVRYITCSFNGSLNYKRAPMLLRMIPTNSPPYRVPYTKLSAVEKEEADKIFPHNIVVLVHGHNEEEKEGIYQTSAPWPWLFAYKRDVWTLFYQLLPEYYFTTPNDATSYLSPEHTTWFYEFVYPSYRGIFNYLDLQLAQQLDAALATQLDLEMPINVAIIAHSMGGLVSRAAIQEFSDPLNARFMDLMTWGTPHMGSPLVSLRYAMGADLPYDFAFENETATALLSLVWPNMAAGYKFGLWSLKHVLRMYADSAQMDTPGTRDLRYVRRPNSETSYRLGLENLFKLSTAQSTPVNQLKYDLQNGSWIYNYNLQLLNQNDRHTGSDKYFPVIGSTDRRIQFKESDNYPWIVIDAITGWDLGIVIDNLQYETAAGATLMPLLVADPDEETLPPTRSSSVGTAGQSDGAANVPSMAMIGISKWVGTAPGWDHEEYYGAPKYTENGQGPTLQATSKGRGMAKFAMQRMVGGNSDSSKGFDRYGVMRTPRFGYRMYPGSNLQSFGDEITINDIGNSKKFTLVGNLNFHQLDDFYEHPFDFIRTDRIRLVSDPERDNGRPISIPVTDVEIAPDELPNVSMTSGSYISISEYVGGNERIFTGEVDIGDTPVANKILRVQFEFVDGSELILPSSFTINSPSLAGTWRLSAFVSNELFNFGGRIEADIENLPVELDAGGHASFSTEYEDSDDTYWNPEARTGDRYSGSWQIEGTLSLVNNRFELNINIDVLEIRDSFDDRTIDERFRYVDVTETVTSEMEVTYVANYEPSIVVGETWTFTPVSTEASWNLTEVTEESIDGGGGDSSTENMSGTNGYASAVLNR